MWHRINWPFAFFAIVIVSFVAAISWPESEESKMFNQYVQEELVRVRIVELPLQSLGALDFETKRISDRAEHLEVEYRIRALVPCFKDRSAMRKKITKAYAENPRGTITLLHYYPEHACEKVVSIVVYVSFRLP